MVDHIYLIDSDVFITAKNQYYFFNICPGFWKSLIHHHTEGSIFSIDQVHKELLTGKATDPLVRWMNNEVPKKFFLSTKVEQIIEAYEKIILWVTENPQYFDQAKQNFATSADGWLVAHAIFKATIVITNEKSSLKSEKSIKLPDVCNQFGVRWKTHFSCSKLSTFNLIGVNLSDNSRYQKYHLDLA
ncbi:MAG: DUF4411 family protein [Bacteroidetes bacterium]|nr:DUF4411 family protein [Bacteroidota bacterium]MCY4206003.1 DUF4411 family protein [Bacteroidota bacterium]